MRIFLAVFPPPETQQLVRGAIDSVRRPGDGVSWVRRDNLHYTLRFLGEIGADGLRRAGEAAAEAAAGQPAFDVVLGAAGAFPNPSRARVLWVGLSEGEAPFVALAQRLEAALERRGFERERRGFTPHLTIGRVREPGTSWDERLARVPSLAAEPAARFRVGSIAVVQSQLDPAGSIYRVVAEGRLEG